MPMTNRLYAEFLGTAWLVLGGCGSAVLAAAFPQLGIGFAGVALAFGLTVVTMAYAVAPVSGAHFNPAITVGLAVGGRFPWSEVVQYVIAQVLGGIAGAAILYVIATGKAGAEIGSFATNGYGELSPGKYGLLAAAVIEVVMTFGFVTVILGVTDKRAAAFAPAAPLAIGLDAHPHPSDQHSRHQHLGEPGAQHGAGPVRRRPGAGAALAVLGGAAGRRRDRRPGLRAARPQGLTARPVGAKDGRPSGGSDHDARPSSCLRRRGGIAAHGRVARSRSISGWPALPGNIQGCIAADPQFTREHVFTLKDGEAEITSPGGIHTKMKLTRAQRL